ncbi:MAG: BMP family ABC transporter substrate-binding protein [Propionibacteriales bacterium]|nr:BMP family ABC transporter substrate-binding protein [Propionibacteriales bacterium]
MKKHLLAVPSMLAAATFALAACAAPPSEKTADPGTQPSGSGSAASGSGDFKACMVSDSGGFDDKSFNQTSYKGLTDAKEKLGIQTGEIESKNVADFTKNIQSMVDAKCNVIVTVGFLLSDATVAAAKANPEIKFANVDPGDYSSYASVKNLKPLVFNTAQSSFMAGYLAAATSQTGKVGTFGGAKIPTVTIFMDGFAQGVAYFNQQKGKDVQVLGWNTESQDGQFVPGDTPFENVNGGKTTAQNLVSQGADVIMPVAGPAGEGALQVAKASGGKVSAIWVDTDGCQSAESYCSNIMTSVYKAMDEAVTQAITDAKNDSFTNEPYVGTLENNGTGLSPYNEFDSKIPADVKADVDKIKADISSGAIKIESESQPKG